MDNDDIKGVVDGWQAMPEGLGDSEFLEYIGCLAAEIGEVMEEDRHE